MAITPLPSLDRTSPSFRTELDTYFGTSLPAFASQANELAANLNSIAAGGAYAIPYKIGTSYGGYSNSVDSSAGILAFDSAAVSQSVSGNIFANMTDAAGNAVGGALDQFDDSTSVVRGHIRLVKISDPTKWMRFNITSATSNGTAHRAFGVTLIDSSSASPFVTGDTVLLFFQRTGDKGDTGPMNPFTSAKLSDRKSPGTNGGASTAGTMHTRTLNTVEHNTITGLALNTNQVTLPAGTYDVCGRAPGYNAQTHQAFLYNVTDAAYAILGSSAYAFGTSQVQSDSIIRGRLVLTASKVFAVRHWIQVADAAGLGASPVSTGQSCVFTEITFTKVA